MKYWQLIWLSIGACIISTQVFMMAGLLAPISRDLSVDIGTAGHLVTAFAISYAVGAPAIAAVSGRVDRRLWLVVALLMFSALNLYAALAQNFQSLLVARSIMALCAAAFMPHALAYIAAATESPVRGRALGTFAGGMHVAVICGAPLCMHIGATFSWRSSFAALSVLGMLATAGLTMALERQPVRVQHNLLDRLRVLQVPGVMPTLAITVFASTATWSFLTYLVPILQSAGDSDGKYAPLAVLALGVVGPLGTLLGAYAIDGWRRSWSAVRAMLAFLIAGASMIWLGMVWLLPPVSLGTLAVGLILYAIASSAMPTLQQSRMIEFSGDRAAIALSMTSSAIYLGMALGASSGSVVMSQFAAHATPALAVGWLLIAFYFGLQVERVGVKRIAIASSVSGN